MTVTIQRHGPSAPFLEADGTKCSNQRHKRRRCGALCVDSRDSGGEAVEPDSVPDWREPLTINKLAVSETSFGSKAKLNLTIGFVPFLNVSAGLLGFFFVQSRRASSPSLGF
jgi:hypothetical protein